MKLVAFLVSFLLTIPFVFMSGILILVMIDSILSYLTLKDIQWATWLGSFAAILAAFYTRRIWINNVIRNDIREITSFHYKIMSALFEILDMGYFPSNKFSLEVKLIFYYKYLYKIEGLEFSNYLGKLEEMKFIKDDEISKLATELLYIVNDIFLYFKGFLAEVESLKGLGDPSDKAIIVDQANKIFERLNNYKDDYRVCYEDLKKVMNKRIKRV